MKRSIKETLLRLLILFGGLIIAHLGVTLFLQSALGADPFNVLVQGLCRLQSGLLGLSHGTVHIAVCVLIIILLLIIDRSYIKLGTLVCMACGGPIIDAFTWLLGGWLNAESALWVRIVMLAAGCVILAFGMTIVIKSDAGTGPNDLVAVVISDKTKAKFSIIRIATDAAFVLVGALLGGVFGAGTIVCVALVGPVAGLFMPINERWINAAVARAVGKKQGGGENSPT